MTTLGTRIDCPDAITAEQLAQHPQPSRRFGRIAGIGAKPGTDVGYEGCACWLSWTRTRPPRPILATGCVAASHLCSGGGQGVTRWSSRIQTTGSDHGRPDLELRSA